MNLPANAGNTGDAGLIPEWGRSSGEGNDNPLQYFWSGKLHGQRSLMGYSPWGCKESDITEHTHTDTTHTHTHQDRRKPHTHNFNHSICETQPVSGQGYF